MPQLTINWMYPDLLSLYGDRGNLMALHRWGAWLGLDVQIRRVNSGDPIEPAHLAVFNSGDLDVAAMLTSRHADHLRAAVAAANQTVVFATSLALFARTTARQSNPDVVGLGLIPADTQEMTVDLTAIKQPFGDDYLLELAQDSPFILAGQRHLAGFYIKTLAVDLDPKVSPFADVSYGLDNTTLHRHGGNDGATHDSICWTGLLGPALVRNPWLTVALIELGLADAATHPDEGRLRQAWSLEQQSLAAVTAFAEAKRADPRSWQPVLAR
ncbi:MAG: hypothetical protein LBV30_10195 [Propionibacteriaceae bacterium]|jgi:CobQ-like glutamine amidotransferase family enzyme|nr:hypothetical protein [Propionibacteriaceae bacterium]